MTTALSDAPPCTPRTTIMGLPSEILSEIFFSVDREYSKILWSLCLTCKHFRDIVEKHCEPEYNLRGKQIEDPFKFLVQLRDQPHLRKLIRSVRLNLGSAAHSTCAKEEMQALVSSLGLKYQPTALFSWGGTLAHHGTAPVRVVASLPKVESLEVTSRVNTALYFDYFSSLLRELELFANSSVHWRFAGLRNLALCDPNGEYLIPRVPSILFTLPSLRKVLLQNFYLVVDADGKSHFRQSNVVDLHIINTQRRYNKTCAEAFSVFRSLKHFHLTIVDALPQYRYEVWYIDGLRSLAHSLETLELHTNERYFSEAQIRIEDIPSWLQSSQESLLDFKHLKTLAMTYMKVIGTSSNGPHHWNWTLEDSLDHLANKFPPSLEYFTHLVWDGPSIFDDLISKRQVRSWEQVWKAASRTQFPSLKKVMVQKYGLNGLSQEREVIWETPE